MAFPKTFKLDEGLYTVSKLKSGQKVKIRVLSDFITGRSVWGDPKNEGKRVCTRIKDGDQMPVGAIGWNEEKGIPEKVKQFIAAVVWNYDYKQVEIFETDKPTIIGQILNLEEDSDWGDAKQYDLSIKKDGQGYETKYTVTPVPSKEKIEADWSYVNLEALYEGKDPFQVEAK